MKTSYFRGLNTAHFIFTILMGHPRNTCQICRAGQIKFAVFRLQSTFFSFAVIIWHPSATAVILLQSIAMEYFAIGISVAITTAATAVYGIMLHMYGGRSSPLTSTAALK